MEIKRKKISAAEIYAAEQKSAEQVKLICENKNSFFRDLGHELVLEFVQKENEAQARFEVFSEDAAKKFESGYLSRAVITVKRKKTEKELEEDRRLLDENRQLLGICETEETDAVENGEIPYGGEDPTKRAVAFTGVMLVRVYKSFWTEWVCLGDELGRLEEDLNEFLEALKQKQAEMENS